MTRRRNSMAVLVTLVLAGVPAGAARAQQGKVPNAPLSFLDASTGAPTVPPAPGVSAAALRLREQLGSQTIVDVDPKTGTPRQIMRLDGFLTGPHHRPPREVAEEWIDENTDLLGLTDRDEDRLQVTAETTSPAGVSEVTFAQRFEGLQAFNASVRVSVDADGRVLSVTGSPTRKLHPNTTSPKLTADEARADAVQDAGASGAEGVKAKLVLFARPQGARLAWSLSTVTAPTGAYVYVVDAVDGSILWRQNTSDAATGLAWDYYPSSLLPAVAGTQQSRDFTGNGWLPAGATVLSGPNAHVYADVNDNNAADASEEIPPTGGNWNYPPTFVTGAAPLLCSAEAPCMWNPFTGSSWTTNEDQNATQLFYYVNTFHDWLAGDPFGFTAASGGFDGNDPVRAEALDGANGPNGLPDSAHRNNANMSTPPDGQSPRMQMYLFRINNAGNITAANTGDDASVVYHEYTHGLSNRLVTFPNGNSGLTTEQAAAMGEGWSDWYAMDYLYSHGFASGPVNVGFFMNGNRSAQPNTGTLRTEPMNCRPGSPTTTDGGAPCHGPAQLGDGGYTFGDYGKIVGQPEVHADGEIWAQMLWALREDLVAQYGPTEGLLRARRLITDGMRLTPPAPSMLDARNAILAADTATTGGQDRARLWDDFANHGLGYFASVVDGDDAQPVQDTHVQPVGPGVPVTGRVTDVDTGLPVAGIRVGFGGHISDLASDLVAQTAADGSFTIPAVPQGTYPQLIVDQAGYDRIVPQNVVVGATGATVNVAVRRDWASTVGGARPVTASAPAFGAPCRAADAFDQSQATGWASTSPANPQSPGAKQVTVQLPQPVDITAFAVDPGAICGDADSASVGPLQIATSADGVTFAPAAAATFGPANNHRLNLLAPTANGAGVRFVRVTMLAPQSTLGDGAQFMDLAELEVYGRPAGTPAPAGGPAGVPPAGGPPSPGPPAAPPSGGAPPAAPAPAPAPATPPRAPSLADVAVRSCRQSGKGRRVKLTCVLVNARAVSSADLRLAKGRTTLARGRAKPNASGALGLKLKSGLKKGRYRVTLKLHDAAGHTRTMTSRFRV
jgi:extracellular elastinolytic metalloproteinase